MSADPALAMLRTARTRERLTRSESKPHSGPVKASAGVRRYRAPAWAGVRWAYSVARMGNSEVSMDDVPETRKPNPAYRTIGGRVVGGRVVGGAGLREAPSVTTAGTGCATFGSRGTSSSTGSAGSSDRAKATTNVRSNVPAVQVSRTPAMLLPAAPAVVLAVWYQAKAEATAFLPPFSAISAFTDGSRTA